MESALVDHVGHTIEVDEEAEEDLVGCGAVLVDTHEVAVDCNAGDILAVESENAGSLLGEVVLRGELSMYACMLLIVLGCDSGQQSRHHLDDILDRHRTDLILLRAF